ncbi:MULTISPECIES: hypothetical protein [Bradyrhizobium]|jgi:hypothetical protein|uniref:hypothetical protein n=1 Tax=Bradyrhizobium TaxID=374 RepID=UPI00041854C0|nr:MULTISPECIES: hypothetical protein [Bradyrhizobium]AUC98360.1 hypothetical protein CWS35_31985 [Bradyrhizobium sp. SK17]KIU52555.1 hypothetical protein QU41_02525 [Bradyrhizobium elkanii]MBK5651999.1 hypothetical protein [Rhizobium sp.]OCX32659.1 hypothetical protein QU42_02630 [Bradyrhizobium sp. UASWS1016]
MRKLIFTLAAWLALTPVFAAQTNWTNTCTTWHFNPNNVRDPTIVFNNTSLPNWGVCPGYDGTPYEFHPCNFAPNTTPATCSDGTGPKDACANTWTQIPLWPQFNIPATAKEVILTGNSYITGPNQWTATVYAWFRAPGSTWALSPIFDGGYMSTLVVHAPVGLVNGVPNIEMAWRAEGATLAPAPNPDTVALVMILSGWCE